MKNPFARRQVKKTLRSGAVCLLCLLLTASLSASPALAAPPEETPAPDARTEEPVTAEAPEAAADTAEVERAVFSAGRASALLNTDEHFAYVEGSGGLFRPDKEVTRAEAAKMIYSLLRSKDVPRAVFPDVEDQWYADAVEVMGGLGVIEGYGDGSFQAGNGVTRAEFVKMVVSCDGLTEGAECAFSDVSPEAWYAPYVATAAANGWVNGFGDGTFRPESKITRAQAVTILNGILGRSPDADVKEKTDATNFYDVFPEHWAYGQILEAATDHTFSVSDGEGEVWTWYQPDTEYPEADGWVKDGSTMYYLNAKTRKFLRGEQIIGGKTYIFSETTGAAYTGFRMKSGWRRYYKDGLLQTDISGLGVVTGPYMIKVYKNANYLIVFARDGNGTYNTPVRAMRTSCGVNTPVGTYYTPAKYRWLRMVGDTWAQWCTQITGGYLFHSVPNWTKSNMDLEVDEYNHLGETRSLGCIRLNCRDAKWIYDNCSLGAKVTVTTTESGGPLPKPDGIQIPSWHTWDPTDPTAYWRCQQNGCH